MRDDQIPSVAAVLGISEEEVVRLKPKLHTGFNGRGEIDARWVIFTEPIPVEIAMKIRGLEGNEVPLDLDLFEALTSN